MFANRYSTEHDLARHVLYKGCNAVLDHPGDSLRASREAIVRGVAPLGKDAPTQYRVACYTHGNGENRDPARRTLRPTASQLAEPIKPPLLDYYLIIQSQPVESRSRIRLSARRHITMAGNLPR